MSGRDTAGVIAPPRPLVIHAMAGDGCETPVTPAAAHWCATPSLFGFKRSTLLTAVATVVVIAIACAAAFLSPGVSHTTARS